MNVSENSKLLLIMFASSGNNTQGITALLKLRVHIETLVCDLDVGLT